MSAGIYISTLFLPFSSQKKTPVSICHLLYKVRSFILKYYRTCKDENAKLRVFITMLLLKAEKTEATPNSSEFKKAWLDFFSPLQMLKSYNSECISCSNDR